MNNISLHKREVFNYWLQSTTLQRRDVTEIVPSKLQKRAFCQHMYNTLPSLNAWSASQQEKKDKAFLAAMIKNSMDKWIMQCGDWITFIAFPGRMMLTKPAFHTLNTTKLVAFDLAMRGSLFDTNSVQRLQTWRISVLIMIPTHCC